MSVKINDPKVVAEIETAFARYDTALNRNDVVTLNSCFWENSLTIRYGIGENLYGIGEIAAFRAAASTGVARRLSRTVITTFGDDFATVSTLQHRDSVPGKVGRQMQTWVRLPEGWRVVAAHVSMIDDIQ